MVAAEGMGIAPWGALGRGQFRSAEEYNKEDREGRKMGPQREASRKVGEKLAELAQKKGTITTSVALAYVTHKAPYTFPIVGGRKVEHLKGNIEALGVKLTDEEVQEIEAVEPFDPGFPLSFLFGPEGSTTSKTASDVYLVTTNTNLETVQPPRPIEPGQGERRLAANK